MLFELLLVGLDIVVMLMGTCILKYVLSATAVLVAVCSQLLEILAACMNICDDRCADDFSPFQVGVEPCSSVMLKGILLPLHEAVLPR